MSPYLAAVLSMLGAALGAAQTALARTRRGTPGAAWVGALGFLVAAWCIVYTLRQYPRWETTAEYLTHVQDVAQTAIPATVLLAMLAFAGHTVRRRTAVLLYLGSAVVLALFWIDARWDIAPDNVLFTVGLSLDLLVALALVVLASTLRTLPPGRRRVVPLMTAAIVLPWVLSWLYQTGHLGTGPEPTPQTFAVSSAIVAYCILRLHFLDVFLGLIPVGRAETVQMMEEGILVLDRRGQVVDVNPAACALLGIPRSGLLGTAAAQAFPGWPPAILAGERASATVTVPGPPERSLELRARPLSASGGASSGRIVVVRDVTERRLWEARLARQALHDPLTGLANRVQVRRALEEALADASARPVALLLLDLDHFKDVNDTLGHPAGDRVLVEVAVRLERCVEPGQTVGRLGGDEFALVAPRCDRSRAESLARALITALEREFRVDVAPFAVGASVGVVQDPDGVGDADEMLRRADIALYAAKRVRRTVSFWEPGQEREAVSRLGLRERLLRAIADHELELHYQPQYRLSDRRVVGAEALVRWRHPERGLLLPSVFVPVAEEVGAIADLTVWVTRRALFDCADWRRQGHRVRVAVNLSAHLLDDPELPGVIGRAAADAGGDPSMLTVELTESAVVRDLGQGGRSLQALRDRGVGVSIDDFGVGYSSLAHLSGLPVTELKVDRHFVQRLHRAPADRIIVGSVVSLGHQLGFPVVAEGVEDADQLAAMRGIGCDIAQGFHVCPPVPRDRFLDWLRRGAPLGAVPIAAGETPVPG